MSTAVPTTVGKLVVTIGLAALLLSVSAGRLGTWKDPGYRATAEFLATSGKAGDIIVLPYIMDTPLGYYVGETILEQMTQALRQHHIGRLLVVTHATDARMKLGNYWLIRDDLMRSGIVFPTRHFEEVFASNSVRVQWLNQKGFRFFPSGNEIWSVPEGQQHTVTARPGRPLTSDWPSIGVEAADGTPFQLNASTRFKAPVTGVAVVVSARSHPKGRVTIGEVVREGPDTAGTVLPLRMMKSFSLPLLGQSSSGETWYLNSSLRPVEAGKTYTVCLTGEGDGGGVQYFADMICYYFPL